MGDDAEPSQILAHVFLGSRAHARDKELLQRLGITHVLNVTPPKTMDPVAGVPNFFEKDKLFTYRRCPIFDNKAEDISGVLEGCVAFMDQAKYYGRILVHCNKGVSRSSSMVVAYLMKLRAMSFEQALAFVVERRPIANPNESFRRQLQEYGRRLQRSAPKEKGARVARGPAGPQLPPSAKASGDGEEESSAAIGPQLPPHLMNARKREAEATSVGSSSKEVVKEVSTDEEKVVIGPSLPPNLKRQHVETNEQGGEDGEASSKKKKVKADE
ncbi:phosphatase Slingshot 2 protein [Phytophthora cinnamomi]|uniref:phosphatase Slingshot 2 protein n=1 Tax=Phytophthora cinnamomi TaxID=4785 RepID=UPI00355A481F|nr:phosphatase Slingshot 2 protein [Phytophthora cinnamomi]